MNADLAPATTIPPPAAEEMASASPDRVRPGDQTTLTPGGAVERSSSDAIVVYDFDNAVIGRVTGGDRWEPATSAATPTSQPDCLTTVSAAGVIVVVPPLTEGGYRFCIAVVNDYRGCATVFVSAA